MAHVLIIDHRQTRRKQIRSELGIRAGDRIEDVSGIARDDAEGARYDYIVVHYSNSEARYIENEAWCLGDAKIVFYSGSFSSPREHCEGVTYVSQAALFEMLPNLEAITSPF